MVCYIFVGVVLRFEKCLIVESWNRLIVGSIKRFRDSTIPQKSNYFLSCIAKTFFKVSLVREFKLVLIFFSSTEIILKTPSIDLFVT